MEISVIIKKNAKIVSVIELERFVASTGIFGMVIYEFCHGQEFCPVILLLSDKGLNVCLHYAVLPLCLTICLRIEGCK